MYNYMISTDDTSAANLKIEEIKKSLESEYDDIGYDLEDDSLYSLIDELVTVSLFDSPKFITVKNAHLLSGASEKAALELFSAMNDRDSQNVIIFLFTEEIDMKNANIQKLKKYTTYFDMRVKNVSLEEYALNSFLSDGYQIQDSTAHLLSNYVDSLSSLQRAIEILKTYKIEDKIILPSDIEKMVQKPLDENVYNLVDSVLSHNQKKVFEIYHDLRIRNVPSSYLISLLINKFQEMYNVSILIKANMSKDEIATLFKVSPGRAYYMVQNAKSSNLGKIKDNLDYLNQLDMNIKTGKVDADLGLELFFLK